MLRFSGAGVSDVGLVRSGNEDSAFVGPYVAIVADGVGGAAAGEVASATATYALAATVLSRFGELPEELLRAGAEAARASVQAGVQRDLNRLGMATTLTAVVCDGERVALGHVGDSRAYLLRDAELIQLSRDHTYVQRLVDSGQLEPGTAWHHPWRNVVLRSIDGDPLDEGIDLVPDPVVAELLGTADAEDAADALVQAALAAGGKDNVTCVVLDVVDGPLVVGDGQLRGAVFDPANIVDPAAVRVG